MTFENSINFIDNLELPEIPGGYLEGPETAPDLTRSSFSDGGSVVSFVGNISQSGKTDVLNSFLLAQLASNKKYDRYKQPKEWYKFYVTVLENIGWTLQGFNFKDVTENQQGFTINKSVLKILTAMLTGPEIAAITAALIALETLADDDGRLQVFKSESSSDKGGNFQVASATETNGSLAVNLGGFYLGWETNQTDVLWIRWKSYGLTIWSAVQPATLNQQYYDKIKANVEAKLGANATKFISDLEI